MKLLTKFRGKKGEMVPIRPDLHDILLGKCYTILIEFYTNLYGSKAFYIYMVGSCLCINIDNIKYQLRKLCKF